MKALMSKSSSTRRSAWTARFPAWSKVKPQQQRQQQQQQQQQPFLHRALKRARLAELCFTASSSSTGSRGGEEEEEEDDEGDEHAMMVLSTDSSMASSRTAAASSGSFCSSSGSTSSGAVPVGIVPSSSVRSNGAEDGWRDGAFHGVQAVARKRVMVVVDGSREAKTALLWALSHVVHKLDVVTLLHVLYSDTSSSSSSQSLAYDSQDPRAIVSDRTLLRSEEKGCELISSLKNLCALRQPEVEVEVVVVAGERGPTIVRQAKKLDASILVLGQKKLNFFQRCLRWNKDDDQFIDYCIQHADCLTLSVRRKSKQCGGYLINSKWQKNFWLLA